MLTAATKYTTARKEGKQKLTLYCRVEEQKRIYKIVACKLQSPACWNKDASQCCHIPEHVLVQRLQVGRCTQVTTPHTSYNKYKQAALALTELPPFPLLGASNWFWQELLHMLTEPSSTSLTFEIIYILVICVWNLSALNYIKILELLGTE